jgi:D-alanine-D-alanine ligase
MKVLVLGGGDSSEREVSLRSAAMVRAACERLGYDVGYFDPRGRMEQLVRVAQGYDVVLPILHGTGGEDGEIQKVLEASGRPFFGSGSKASALCFNKVRTKELMRKHRILTPEWAVVMSGGLAKSKFVRQPFVLKPIDDGSSVDTMIVRQLPYDPEMVADLFTRHREMLLEELIFGIEITVTVLGDKALPAIEIIPPEGSEFDYENKYNGATQELCPPKHVSRAVQTEAGRLAELVSEITGARHLARIDMIVAPEDELYVLEINTLPGLTDQSLAPKSAAAAGLKFDQLVARFIELATDKD